MSKLKYAFLALAATALFALPAHKADAQVSIGIGVGGPPVCAYGYYGYAPYRCAPYGYYGPEWFNGGAFIGAGRWYHGDRRFYGNVNRRYDPRYGYRGGYPNRGEGYREPADHWQGFQGTHRADPRGGYHGRAGGGDNHGRGR
jgi:hypothetical protein